MNCTTCGTPLYTGLNHTEPCPKCSKIIEFLQKEPLDPSILTAIDNATEYYRRTHPATNMPQNTTNNPP